MLREIIRTELAKVDPELESMVDELVPYTEEFSYNLVSILSEDELPQELRGDSKLMQRYKQG